MFIFRSLLLNELDVVHFGSVNDGHQYSIIMTEIMFFHSMILTVGWRRPEAVALTKLL